MSSEPFLIGITGKKRHGKDTFAGFVKASFPGAMTIAFADALRDLAQRVYGLTEDQMLGDDLKEAPLPAPILMDLHLQKARDLTGLSLKPLGHIATTPRQVLQYLGTEYVRGADPTYWIRKVDTAIKAHRGSVIVTDVRHLNEAELVRSRGGRIVLVVRTDAPVQGDQHSSENLNTTPDVEVRAKTGELEFLRQAAMNINEVPKGTVLKNENELHISSKAGRRRVRVPSSLE